MARRAAACRRCIMAGLATDRLQKPVELARRPARAARAARRTDRRRARSSRRRPRPASSSTSTPARSSRWCRCRTTIPNNPEARPTIRLRINRLTTGVFEMGSTFKALTLAMALDSGKYQPQLDARCARRAALRQVHHQRLPRAEPHADACRRSSPTRRTSAPRAWRSALGVEHHKAFLQEDGPARPAAHRTAGKRRADRAASAGAS